MKVITVDKNGKEIDLNKVKVPKEIQVKIFRILKGSAQSGEKNNKSVQAV